MTFHELTAKTVKIRHFAAEFVVPLQMTDSFKVSDTDQSFFLLLKFEANGNVDVNEAIFTAECVSIDISIYNDAMRASHGTYRDRLKFGP